MAHSLIWVYTICPDLSARKLRKIMVYHADVMKKGRWKCFVWLPSNKTFKVITRYEEIAFHQNVISITSNITTNNVLNLHRTPESQILDTDAEKQVLQLNVILPNFIIKKQDNVTTFILTNKKINIMEDYNYTIENLDSLVGNLVVSWLASSTSALWVPVLSNTACLVAVILAAKARNTLALLHLKTASQNASLHNWAMSWDYGTFPPP